MGNTQDGRRAGRLARLNPLASIKRRFGVAGVVVTTLCLALAGAAFAYYVVFTGANGSGTISNVGTSGGTTQTNTAVTLTYNQTSSYSPTPSNGATTCNSFAPGCYEEVDITAANDNPSSAETLTAVPPTPTITVDSAHAAAGCLASWFSWQNVTVTSKYNTSIPIGATSTALGDAALMFNDSGTNQNACQGATLTLTSTGGTTSP